MAVQEIIQGQIDFANESVDQADDFLSRLADLASTSYFIAGTGPVEGVPDPGYGFDTTDDTVALLTGFFPDALVVPDISATAPSFTAQEVDPLDDVAVPDFGKVAPTLEFPEPPSAALPTVPTAPAISDPVLPSAPTITLPASPDVGAITLPEPPSIEIPAMTITLPDDDLVTPTNDFTFNEVAYTSALKDALTAKLLDGLENGGYGIEPVDEAALFDRARTREMEAQQAEADALLADAAARGWPIPPGDVTVALQRSQQNLASRLSGINREIALKRADLYVENRRFTMQEVRSLETVLIGYHNSVMERSLNAAKAVLDAAIRVFEVQVSRAQYRLERYKADALVFEARVRAAGLQNDIFRTRMEGARIEADIQRVRVEVYNAQIAGQQAVIGLYTAQMNAAKVQAEIEGLRIAAFQALVEAYRAQVQAKQAEFQMFEARIRGETAKVQAYESEARAYTATVEGARAKADIAIARLKGQIEEQQQRIAVFQAQMEQYKTDIGAQAQVIDARVKVYGGQVQGASAKAQAVGEAHRIDLGEKDLEFRRNVENAKIKLEEARLSLQAALGSADARVRAGGAAAGFYQALIGAAINSINTLSALTATE